MRWGPLWLILSTTSALALPRTVTIGAGDCKNADLISAVTVFSTSVGTRAGVEVLSSEAVLERFRPAPTISVDDLGRQLEAAQSQFYAGTYDKALETLRQAISGIERLSPRADPWKLMGRARMLQALVFKSVTKKTEASDAQKRVLRIDPQFKLDSDYYTPSSIQAFEVIRKDVQKSRKVRLTITSQPSGSDVFVDGAPVGKTPFGAELIPGDYRVSLANGDALSFTREVKLVHDEALQIDLAFEGALSAQPPLCMAASGPAMVDSALKLAALAGADNVVVLRLESRNNEPGWVTATLLEVNKGTKVRDGGIRFTGARRNDALGELAGFVLTGKASAAVVSALAPTPPAVAALKVDTPIAEPVKAPPAVASAPVAAISDVPVGVEQQSARGIGPRVVSLVVVGLGLAAAGSAGGIYASGDVDRRNLASFIDAQGRIKPGSLGQAKAAQDAVSTNGTTTVILGAGGGALVAVGAALFFLMPPRAGAQLSLAASPNSLWVGTSLSF